MSKKQIPFALVLITLTSLMLTGCSLLPPQNQKSVDVEKPNLCLSGLSTFVFNEDELRTVSDKNKRNAAQLNCALYLYCEAELPQSAAEICEKQVGYQ